MARYVAFLRAVNVGGRVVKMEELRKICALPGMKNISTYIQSGNVIFESSESASSLKKKLEAALKKKLGYEVLAFVLSEKDIATIIKQNPFEKTMKDEALYVTLMSDKVKTEDVKALEVFKKPEESLGIIGTTAYFLCPQKTYGETKLSNTAIEKKLKVSATTRNWATMNKVLSK